MTDRILGRERRKTVIAVVARDLIHAKKASRHHPKTKMIKNVNKARKVKVEKVGPDLDPSLPDPVALTVIPTQIPG